MSANWSRIRNRESAPSWRNTAISVSYTHLDVYKRQVLGSELFFYSRVIHAGLYLAGVPMIRPLVWAAGLAGTVMVLLTVLRSI